MMLCFSIRGVLQEHSWILTVRACVCRPGQEGSHACNGVTSTRQALLLCTVVCRDWRAVMTREAIDIFLPERATPEQSIWLSETRVPVRSISFPSHQDSPDDVGLNEAQLTSTMFIKSTDILAASTRTLEVRCLSGRWLSVPDPDRSRASEPALCLCHCQ